MACRCSRSTRVFLPFLYPPYFAPNGSNLVRAGASFAANKRHSSTDAHTASSATTSTARLNPTPDDYSIPNFADKAQLSLYAGSGGHGCISFLREAYLADGPANGGDGGHGGNIYIQAVHGVTSLHKLARKRHIRAGRGKSGMGGSRGGQRGEDVILTVPVGTVVTEIDRNDPEAEVRQLRDIARKKLREARKLQRALEAERSLTDGTEDDVSGPAKAPSEDEPNELEELERDQWILYPGISSSERRQMQVPRLPRRDRMFEQPKAPLHLDLSRPTPQPILLAAGGLGGLGNPHFVSKERPKPLFATRGERAVSMNIELELRLLADVGLVGLPNAGKSTLLRSLTNSRARVGNWAFTTLTPNVGTVVLDDNKSRPILTSYRRAEATHDPFSLESDQPELERRTRFTIADIPGLIEGAHLDKGLGIAFLRHVERAGVLAFVVDLGAGNAVKALKALWNEVGLYAQMREDEERQRQRQASIDWSADAGLDAEDQTFWPSSRMLMADYDASDDKVAGLHIAGKPWFVVATKGDLPNTQGNFGELIEYLTKVTNGEEPHPSGVKGAWTRDCAAIPVSAINGHGMDRIIHWTVGLLDGSV